MTDLWIKTKDALPNRELLADHLSKGCVNEYYADCYICINGEVMERPFNFEDKCWYSKDYDDFEFEATKPSHWMLANPCPKPPKD